MHRKNENHEKKVGNHGPLQILSKPSRIFKKKNARKFGIITVGITKIQTFARSEFL